MCKGLFGKNLGFGDENCAFGIKVMRRGTFDFKIIRVLEGKQGF